MYRWQLLNDLGVPFTTQSPEIDESPRPGESAGALVRRLAHEKALAVVEACPESLIIGADQVAVVNGAIVGKPHSHERAVAQLEAASGKEVHFLTGICVLDAISGQHSVDMVEVTVGFKVLSKERIEAYLLKDQPYQCAGAIRAEGAGCALFTHIRTQDPSALIGLPLIRLSGMLEEFGFDVLA